MLLGPLGRRDSTRPAAPLPLRLARDGPVRLTGLGMDRSASRGSGWTGPPHGDEDGPVRLMGSITGSSGVLVKMFMGVCVVLTGNLTSSCRSSPAPRRDVRRS
ncbi:hypothetical protein EYF80_056392 [Liparis tanakae]|uniref:Uncharacterized protein n=1 Tax=Liparis tanakae TaxID=230148 RepID=A0A4Z2EXB1_9TELE|nr:hypothetical protein EYF80_056392 [Liparis tanakae]